VTKSEMRALFEKWVLEHWDGWLAALATPSVASPHTHRDFVETCNECRREASLEPIPVASPQAFCPSCKSTAIEFYANAGGLKMYRCHECGWHAATNTLASAPVGEPGRTPPLSNEGMMFVVDVNNSDYSEREVIKALARWGYKAYRIKDNIPAAPPAQVAPTPESWELAARFNDWWNENGIDFLPSLDLTKGAAKELAKTAWEAALSEVAALAAQGAPGTREPQFTAEELRSCIFTYADGQINFGVTLGRVNNVLRKKHRALAQPGAPTKEG
jgi:hypothetical protein